MIMRHIDRSRSTGGGMAASFVIHGGLLLILALLAGQRAATIKEGGELTEIAYIEAKYGEDVAAKVKLKQTPPPRPEPPGRGVNTDSAMKAPAEPSPTPTRQTPKPTLKAPVKVAPATRPAVARMDVKNPATTPRVQPKTLAAAPQLAARAPQPRTRQVIDANRLTGSFRSLDAKDINAPSATSSRASAAAFAPRSSGLTSKSGTVALGQDVLAGSAPTRTSVQVAETSGALATGGGLTPAGTASYQGSGNVLAPQSGRSAPSGAKGVLDVDGPTGNGGGPKSGRKTILNYGSGGGGRGGSLNSRQQIAEPPVTREIVTQAASVDQNGQTVAEVKLDGKGVNMTISGQIKGRRILKSVAPLYSDSARKNGWEGVVGVHFTVKADGRVKDNIYFDQTSVHRDLNRAAMAAIKQFVFAPLASDQAAVEQWGVITIIFRLN